MVNSKLYFRNMKRFLSEIFKFDKIVKVIEEMLVSDTAKGANVIIMVGGFSASEIQQI